MQEFIQRSASAFFSSGRLFGASVKCAMVALAYFIYFFIYKRCLTILCSNTQNICSSVLVRVEGQTFTNAISFLTKLKAILKYSNAARKMHFAILPTCYFPFLILPGLFSSFIVKYYLP